MTKTQMETLTIIGRRWFDRVNGNTYFSARAIVDGKEEAYIPYEYGYGDQYRDSIWEEVVKRHGLDVERYQSGGIEGPSYWCRRNGVALHYEAADVRRKKDL